MALTNDILDAVSTKLDLLRRSIDADEGLRSVQIVVKIDQRSGKVRTVIVNRESEYMPSASSV